MKLLTRKQVIEVWNKQGEDHLNSFVCPDCRDILVNHENVLFCENPECSNTERYESIYIKITGKPTFSIEKDFPDPAGVIIVGGGRNIGKTWKQHLKEYGVGKEDLPDSLKEIYDIDPMMVKDD